MIKKPYKRTFRPNTLFSATGYLHHPQFAVNGQKYIDSFKLIQQDVLQIFNYVYPCDANQLTYSLKIQDLYVRACIEVEANFNAILIDNKYNPKKNLNIFDYFKVNATHFLSQYKVKIPHWEGSNKIIAPFAEWNDKKTIDWFQAYNKIKHNKYSHFKDANLLNMMNAVCAVLILLSSQFEIFEQEFLYFEYFDDDETSEKMGLGGYFIIQFPKFQEKDKYEFDWNQLKDLEVPFDLLKFDS